MTDVSEPRKLSPLGNLLNRDASPTHVKAAAQPSYSYYGSQSEPFENDYIFQDNKFSIECNLKYVQD